MFALQYYYLCLRLSVRVGQTTPPSDQGWIILVGHVGRRIVGPPE